MTGLRSEFKNDVLVGGKRKVIEDSDIFIEYSYPIRHPYTLSYHSRGGFCREQLIHIITSQYKQMYAEEEKTVRHKPVIPMDQRGLLTYNIMNRNETDGKYGIWGHDLEDLWLVDIYYHPWTHTVVLAVGSE